MDGEKERRIRGLREGKMDREKKGWKESWIDRGMDGFINPRRKFPDCSSDPKNNVCECHGKSPGVSGGVRLGT